MASPIRKLSLRQRGEADFFASPHRNLRDLAGRDRKSSARACCGRQRRRIRRKADCARDRGRRRVIADDGEFPVDRRIRRDGGRRGGVSRTRPIQFRELRPIRPRAWS